MSYVSTCYRYEALIPAQKYRFLSIKNFIAYKVALMWTHKQHIYKYIVYYEICVKFSRVFSFILGTNHYFVDIL